MRSMQPRDVHFASLISLIEEMGGGGGGSVAWHLTQLFRSRAQSHVVSVITSAKQPSFPSRGRTGSRRARLASIAAYVAFRSVKRLRSSPLGAHARTPTFLSIQEGKKGQSTVTFVHFLLLLNRVRCA